MAVTDKEDDLPIHDYVEMAFAAYRVRTSDPEYVEPAVYVPTPPKAIRKDFDDPNQLDIAKAFSWIKSALSYTNDRLGGPSVDAKALRHLWENFYQYNYAPRQKPLPVEDLAAIHLTTGEWHDVLGRAKSYRNASNANMIEDGQPLPSNAEPHELIMELAKKVSKNAASYTWRRSKAIRYLNARGIHVEHMNLEQVSGAEAGYIDAYKYPRTNL